MPTIRLAVPGDASALARLAEETFRATFAESNPAADMDLHCSRTYGEAQQAAEIADPARITLLAEEGNRLVGYAQLRWGQAPACITARSPVEIQRLYVADIWHGRGVAQALMATCEEAASRQGADAIWLGVWERNPRAIAFYEKCGFAAVGEHVFLLGSDPQRDIVMART